MAGASIFAFVAILMFEMIRPHLLSTDAWMYRIVSVRGFERLSYVLNVVSSSPALI